MIGECTIATLVPDDIKTAIFSWRVEDTGTHKVVAVIDENNTIRELDENNNVATETINEDGDDSAYSFDKPKDKNDDKGIPGFESIYLVAVIITITAIGIWRRKRE